jgi:hypothetical protein
MKKRNLFFFGILLFLPSVFQAKTLVVREYGRGTLYSNLQQAHNAATDGDTLAVDAAADGSWEEGTTVTISKQVYLTTLQNRKLKLINGLEIKLLNNRKLTVTDLDSTYIYITGTGELTIANCLLKEALTIPENVKIKSFKCIYLRKLTSFHLIAMGNEFREGILINLSNSNTNDSVIVIGNVFNKSFVIHSNKTLLLSNNYFKLNNLDVNLYGCDNYGAGIFLINLGPNNSSLGKSIISNNTIFYNNSMAAGYMLKLLNDLDIKKGYILVFSNSFFANLSGNFSYGNYGCGSISGNSYFNFSDYGSTITKNYFAIASNGIWFPKRNLSTNYFGTSIPTIDSLGRLSGPDFTNKGLDLPEFSDIDLTRNDIGTEGGPWPISNFWGPNASKAWVGWLDLPLKITTPSTPIQIKATGINKD